MCRCQSRQERTSEWSKPICPVASVKVSSIVQRVPAARPTSVSGVPLTNLYNARPTWLDLAHRRLDAAVCHAYGWPSRPARPLAQDGRVELGQARARGGVGDRDHAR